MSLCCYTQLNTSESSDLYRALQFHFFPHHTLPNISLSFLQACLKKIKSSASFLTVLLGSHASGLLSLLSSGQMLSRKLAPFHSLTSPSPQRYRCPQSSGLCKVASDKDILCRHLPVSQQSSGQISMSRKDLGENHTSDVSYEESPHHP